LLSARQPTISTDARRRLLELAGRALGPLARRPPEAEPRRILLLRPDHLGDLLLSAPAVDLLRASFPHGHLTYLVGPWNADGAVRGPAVDEVQTLRFPGFTRRPARHLLAPYALLAAAAVRLRRQAYDLAIVLRPDHWWGALLVLAAGVPVRVGFDLPETRPLLTHAIPLDRRQHAAQQAFALATAVARLYGRPGLPDPSVLAPRFAVTEAERAAAGRLLAERGLGGRRLVAVQPSAGAVLKTWPLERWARLIERLCAAGLDVLLVGGPDDGPLLAAVQAHQARPSPAVAGQPLGVSAAIYARCALVVGPDGGGLHLAAAVGTPTLRLYGPAPPAVYGPWPSRPDQRVLITRALACVPCGSLEDPPCGAKTLPACLLALGVEAVVAAAMDAL
jgi:heptosyltransferase-2/heptosyltransferase-3